MSLPFAFFGRPVHMCDQEPACSVTASPMAWPSAYSCTCTESGRRPSASASSIHFFDTLTLVVSTACLFVRENV